MPASGGPRAAQGWLLAAQGRARQRGHPRSHVQQAWAAGTASSLRMRAGRSGRRCRRLTAPPRCARASAAAVRLLQLLPQRARRHGALSRGGGAVPHRHAPLLLLVCAARLRCRRRMLPAAAPSCRLLPPHHARRAPPRCPSARHSSPLALCTARSRRRLATTRPRLPAEAMTEQLDGLIQRSIALAGKLATFDQAVSSDRCGAASPPLPRCLLPACRRLGAPGRALTAGRGATHPAAPRSPAPCLPCLLPSAPPRLAAALT